MSELNVCVECLCQMSVCKMSVKCTQCFLSCSSASWSTSPTCLRWSPLPHLSCARFFFSRLSSVVFSSPPFTSLQSRCQVYLFGREDRLVQYLFISRPQARESKRRYVGYRKLLVSMCVCGGALRSYVAVTAVCLTWQQQRRQEQRKRKSR